MTLTPIRDMLLVRPNAKEDRIGVIYLPDRNQFPPRQGKVLAVGPGRYSDDGTLIPLQVQVGDEIAFNWEHSEHEVDGEMLVLVSESKVRYVVKPEAK